MNTSEAFSFFDRCQPIPEDFMLGRWQGSSFPTDHLLDGRLESYGWYGKEFFSKDQVHPLLFKRRSHSFYRIQTK